MNTILSLPSERTLKVKVCKLLFGRSNLVTCPYCQRTGCVRRNDQFQCRRCKRWWSLTSLTWMKGMKIRWQSFYGLVWCYTQKVPVDQAARLLRLSRPTVYRYFGLFRENLPDEGDAIRLAGEVQVDEAYFGKRLKGYALLAAKERHTNKVAVRIVPKGSVDRNDLLPFLRQHVTPGSRLHTDGAMIYRGIERHWLVFHDYDVHSRSEFGKTSVIEGFFGSLRTFIRRMYHHVTLEKLPEMVKEYQLRLMRPEIFVDPASFLAHTLPRVVFA